MRATVSERRRSVFSFCLGTPTAAGGGVTRARARADGGGLVSKMRGIIALLLAAASPTLSVDNPALALDRSFPRATPGAIRALYNDAPQIPFTNFSAAYVKAALATPTDWRTKGAVTPAKNQGPHGYCGTFGRCGEMEGGWVIKGGKPLTNFSEEMLVDCIGWDQDQFSFFNPKGHMTSEDYPYNLSHYP